MMGFGSIADGGGPGTGDESSEEAVVEQAEPEQEDQAVASMETEVVSPDELPFDFEDMEGFDDDEQDQEATEAVDPSSIASALEGMDESDDQDAGPGRSATPTGGQEQSDDSDSSAMAAWGLGQESSGGDEDDEATRVVSSDRLAAGGGDDSDAEAEDERYGTLMGMSLSDQEEEDSEAAGAMHRGGGTQEDSSFDAEATAALSADELAQFEDMDFDSAPEDEEFEASSSFDSQESGRLAPGQDESSSPGDELKTAVLDSSTSPKGFQLPHPESDSSSDGPTPEVDDSSGDDDHTQGKPAPESGVFRSTQRGSDDSRSESKSKDRRSRQKDSGVVGTGTYQMSNTDSASVDDDQTAIDDDELKLGAVGESKTSFPVGGDAKEDDGSRRERAPVSTPSPDKGAASTSSVSQSASSASTPSTGPRFQIGESDDTPTGDQFAHSGSGDKTETGGLAEETDEPGPSSDEMAPFDDLDLSWEESSKQEDSPSAPEREDGSDSNLGSMNRDVDSALSSPRDQQVQSRDVDPEQKSKPQPQPSQQEDFGQKSHRTRPDPGQPASGAGQVGDPGQPASGAGQVGDSGQPASGAGQVGDPGQPASGAGQVGDSGQSASGAGQVGDSGQPASGAGQVGDSGQPASGDGQFGAQPAHPSSSQPHTGQKLRSPEQHDPSGVAAAQKSPPQSAPQTAQPSESPGQSPSSATPDQTSQDDADSQIGRIIAIAQNSLGVGAALILMGLTAAVAIIGGVPSAGAKVIVLAAPLVLGIFALIVSAVPVAKKWKSAGYTVVGLVSLLACLASLAVEFELGVGLAVGAMAGALILFFAAGVPLIGKLADQS